jgi:hypothetical protein
MRQQSVVDAIFSKIHHMADEKLLQRTVVFASTVLINLQFIVLSISSSINFHITSQKLFFRRSKESEY